MAKTGIIGHRGAAGLALENSHDSMRAALDYAIDAIEFDIHHTKDGKLVVLHDSHTGRIAKRKAIVNLTTFEELSKIKLHNGQHIPTLEEVFQIIGNKMMMVIDIKDNGCAEPLLQLINRYPKAKISFTSLKYRELSKLHKARPDLPIFVRDIWNPFEVVHTARRMRAEGISLNMWLMNPLTYLLARRRKLEIRIYTVNQVWLAHFFQKLYPGIVIYTNHPERFTAKQEE